MTTTCYQSTTNVWYPCHDADITNPDGSTYCARCCEKTGGALLYLVREYEPDGHASPPESLHYSRHKTLAEARAEVRRLLGVKALRPERKWDGGDLDIEAYHMLPASAPKSYGCGGYAIGRGPRQ